MGRQLAPLFFAAFLAYGYNNIFMTLTPSFVVAAGGTLAEAGLQNSVYLAAAVLLRFAFGPAADRWGTKPVMLVGLASFVLGGHSVPAVCRVLADAFGALRAGGRPCFFLVVGYGHRVGSSAARGSRSLARLVPLGNFRFASFGASCGVRLSGGCRVRCMLLGAFRMLRRCFGLRWHHEARAPPMRTAPGKAAPCKRFVFPGRCRRPGCSGDVRCRHRVWLAVQLRGHLCLGGRSDWKRRVVLHAHRARGSCGQPRCRRSLRSQGYAKVVRRAYAAHGGGCGAFRCSLILTGPYRIGPVRWLRLCGRHGVRPGSDRPRGARGAPGDGSCPAAERHRHRYRLRERPLRGCVLRLWSRCRRALPLPGGPYCVRRAAAGEALRAAVPVTGSLVATSPRLPRSLRPGRAARRCSGGSGWRRR